MANADVEAVLREAEAVLKRLDQLRLEAEAALLELRHLAEEQAMQAVSTLAPEDKQRQARAVVQRLVHIVDEVGSWAVARSPVGLAQRLVPEFRAGLEELRALVEAPPPPSATPPTPARHAP